MSYPNENAELELTPVSNTQFDIKKFIFKLIGFLPWIIISIVLCYTGARLYLRYAPQIHKISAYILIKDENENSSDYKILQELGAAPGGKEVQNQIDILESYELTSGIVDSLNLQVQIVAQGRIATSPLYGHKLPVFINPIKTDTAVFRPATFQLNLFDDKFCITKGKSKAYFKYNDTIQFSGRKVIVTRNNDVFADPKGYLLLVRAKELMVNQLRAAINVQKMHDLGGIVEIAMNDEVPERAADIINKLLDAYNTSGLTDKNIVGKKTIRFLRDRVDTVSRELDEIESKSEAFKRDNKLGDISTAGAGYLASVLRSDEEKVTQLGQIQLLNALEKYILNSHKYTDIIPATYSITEPTLTKLIEAYNEAVLILQNQLRISTEKDPTVDRLKNNITEIKGNILKNIKSVREGFSIKLSGIDSTHNNYEDLLSALPAKEREFLKLKRQIGVKEQLYLYLLQKKEETEISLTTIINNTKVIDKAMDQGIISPKTAQIRSFALLIGIIIPIRVMLLLDFFNTKIMDRKMVEEGTRVPIVGELLFDKRKKSVVINSKSRSVLAEQIRLIRTNLKYMSVDNTNKIILVTSFMSGEGKSFLSINLASCLAAGGAKVLLIEMDLRKPKFAKYLKLEVDYGLTDFIVSDIDFHKVIAKNPLLENVDIITSGPVPPNPSEMLMSKRLEKMLVDVRKEYDYVILDTSPVGLVADAFLLDKYADMSLFILRHKYSYKTTVQYIERLFTDKRFNNLGIIVNGIIDTEGMGYGYGYGYGYSYGYGYGYGYHYSSGYYDKGNGNKATGFVNKLLSLFRR